MQKDEVNINPQKDRWKYRRRIAITSFIAILIVLFVWVFGLVTPEKIVVDGILYIIGALAMIVLAYQGVATVDDLGSRHIDRIAKNDRMREERHERQDRLYGQDVGLFDDIENTPPYNKDSTNG